MARYGREVDWKATALAYERQIPLLNGALESALAGESAALEEVARLQEELRLSRVLTTRWRDEAARLDEALESRENELLRSRRVAANPDR